MRDYRDRTLPISFIYTLYLFPGSCPRMNENFGDVQNLFAQMLGVSDRVAFLSISFDPKHDNDWALSGATAALSALIQKAS